MSIGAITNETVKQVNFNGGINNVDRIDLKKNGVTTTVWRKSIQPPNLNTSVVTNNTYYGSVTLFNQGAGFSSTNQFLNILRTEIDTAYGPTYDGTNPYEYFSSARRLGRFYIQWHSVFNYKYPLNPKTGANERPPGQYNLNRRRPGEGNGDAWFAGDASANGWTAGTTADPFGTKKITFVKANTLFTGTRFEDYDVDFSRRLIVGSNNTLLWCWHIATRASNGAINGDWSRTFDGANNIPSGLPESFNGNNFYVYPNNPNKMPVVNNPTIGAIEVNEYMNSIPGVGFAYLKIVADGVAEA
jgi:hypothetical protein